MSLLKAPLRRANRSGSQGELISDLTNPTPQRARLGFCLSINVSLCYLPLGPRFCGIAMVRGWKRARSMRGGRPVTFFRNSVSFPARFLVSSALFGVLPAALSAALEWAGLRWGCAPQTPPKGLRPSGLPFAAAFTPNLLFWSDYLYGISGQAP